MWVQESVFFCQCRNFVSLAVSRKKNWSSACPSDSGNPSDDSNYCIYGTQIYDVPSVFRLRRPCFTPNLTVFCLISNTDLHALSWNDTMLPEFHPTSEPGKATQVTHEVTIWKVLTLEIWQLNFARIFFWEFSFQFKAKPKLPIFIRISNFYNW